MLVHKPKSSIQTIFQELNISKFFFLNFEFVFSNLRNFLKKIILKKPNFF